MDREGMEGVVFPLSADGRRSTSALGRAVVAGALRPVDPVGALSADAPGAALWVAATARPRSSDRPMGRSRMAITAAHGNRRNSAHG